MKKDLRFIVGLSDLHCGDQAAICPVEFEGDHESTRPIRDWLRRAWWEGADQFVARVTGGEPFLLLLNGDLVQGNWSRFGPLLTKSMAKQCRMARVLLEPLVDRAEAVIITEGTEIHTGDDEDEIANELVEMAGSKLIRSSDKRAVHTSARFKMNGQTHTVRHHTTIAGRVATEASGRGIHLADEVLRRVRAGHAKTDVLWTAHNHTYTSVDTVTGTAITTPSWQAVGRHVRKVMFEDTPIVGLVVADYSRREYGESPDVRKYTKPWPESSTISFDASPGTGNGRSATGVAKRERSRRR